MIVVEFQNSPITFCQNDFHGHWDHATSGKTLPYDDSLCRSHRPFSQAAQIMDPNNLDIYKERHVKRYNAKSALYLSGSTSTRKVNPRVVRAAPYSTNYDSLDGSPQSKWLSRCIKEADPTSHTPPAPSSYSYGLRFLT